MSKWRSRNVLKTGAGNQKSLDCHSVQQHRPLQRMNTTSFEHAFTLTWQILILL